MLSRNKRVRFPRQAVARRLLSIMDLLKEYEGAYLDELAWTSDPNRREQLGERLEFLDQTWHEIETVLRSFPYWR